MDSDAEAHLIVLLLAHTATAVPLIHEGGVPSELAAHTAERSGLPVDQLTPVEVSTLLGRPPQSVGDAVVRRCAGEPAQMSLVSANLLRAEASTAAGRDLEAFDRLDIAIGVLGCLAEVVAPDVAARVFLLRGALLAADGRTEEALGEVHTALAFEPNLNWPTGYPVEGQPLLAEAVQEHERHLLTILPADAGTGPFIDGHDVSVEVALTPGLHLAQHSGRRGITSSWLVVGGPATFVLPERFPSPVLDTFTHPTGQVDGAALLAATLDDFEAAYVTHRGGVWLVVGDGTGTSVTELAPARPPEPEPEPEPAPGNKKGKKGKKKKQQDG